MSIERLPNGGYLIATVLNGTRVKRKYFGYSKRDAIALFKQAYSA
jgi:hypothetical protein